MKIDICIIIVIGCYLTQTTAKCPTDEVILPCKCENNNIYCGGNSYYNLRNIFVLISSALKTEDKHFNMFYLNNTAINEIVINVFYDITFSEIIIDSAYNLTKINTHAFTSTNCFVTQFQLKNTPYGNITDNNNIFNSINDMVNISYIIIYNTSLTTIPSNAFTTLNILAKLHIYYNDNLKTLGNYAFYDLNSLDWLVLDGNAFETIPEHAFSFRNRNTITLNIFLGGMPNININSFSYATFSTIKRVIILNLRYDSQLKYLDENIFNPVLANGNQINLYNSPLECDCKLYWLYDNKAVYQSLVHNAICTDGKSVFDEREKYFDCNV